MRIARTFDTSGQADLGLMYTLSSQFIYVGSNNQQETEGGAKRKPLQASFDDQGRRAWSRLETLPLRCWSVITDTWTGNLAQKPGTPRTSNGSAQVDGRLGRL